MLVTELSNRVRALFKNMERLMLNPRRAEDLAAKEIGSYEDPILENREEKLKLAGRMWRGGMLRECGRWRLVDNSTWTSWSGPDGCVHQLPAD